MQGSFANLDCDRYSLTDPISSEETDDNGVLVSFTFAGSGTGTPSSTPSR